MARCVSCSAPLPQGPNVCSYCGSRNDVDLTAIRASTFEASESERLCPSCQCKLRTLSIDPKDELLLEQCPECFGVFFNPGELDALLDRSVSHVYEIDYQRLADVVGTSAPRPVRYVKCPVCATLMNRLNYGSRSGVVVDVCKGHGVWLDGGELRQLLEWRKAGGQLHHEEVLVERAKEERLRRAKESAEGSARPAHPWDERDADRIDRGGLVDVLGGLLSRLIR